LLTIVDNCITNTAASTVVDQTLTFTDPADISALELPVPWDTADSECGCQYLADFYDTTLVTPPTLSGCATCPVTVTNSQLDSVFTVDLSSVAPWTSPYTDTITFSLDYNGATVLSNVVYTI
jgi:hypothetical protein